jgi:hypothetical protein
MSMVLHPRSSWRTLDKIAAGLVYGAIVVLSLVMALGDETASPFKMAIVLFGSVLAITLARMFSELLSHALETGERMPTRAVVFARWRNAHPALSVANLPSVLFLAAGLGWMPVEWAVTASQAYCILILVAFGARVGWVVSRRPLISLAGAACAGGLGFALATLKYTVQ